jgi:hypothetical protein
MGIITLIFKKNKIKMSELENTEENSENFIKQRTLFPDANKYFNFLKRVFRHELIKSGFKRIETSVVTKSELYTASKQEKFNNLKVNPEYSLSSDPSLSILNAYMAHEKIEELQPIYYYYIDNILVEKKDYLKEHFLI